MNLELTYDSFWQLALAFMLFGATLGFVGGFVEAWRTDRKQRKLPQYRVEFRGPRGVVIVDKPMTPDQARRVAAMAQGLVGVRDDEPEDGAA